MMALRPEASSWQKTTCSCWLPKADGGLVLESVTVVLSVVNGEGAVVGTSSVIPGWCGSHRLYRSATAGRTSSVLFAGLAFRGALGIGDTAERTEAVDDEAQRDDRGQDQGCARAPAADQPPALAQRPPVRRIGGTPE